MKLTENGKELWNVTLSLLLIVCGCVFAGYLEEKTAELQVQKETLCEEWQSMRERKRMEEPEAALLDSRSRLERYGKEPGAEQQLEFILDLEQKFGNCISSVNCEEPEILMEDEGWLLTGSNVEFCAALSLEEWKQMTDYILACEEKNRILEMSFHAEAKRGIGEAVFRICRYGTREELP